LPERDAEKHESSKTMMRALVTITLAAAAGDAHAHSEPALTPIDVWLAGLLGAALLLYAKGAYALWDAAPRRSAASYAAPFGCGWILLALALLPPLAALSGETFSGHMLQHEVLMVAAAPLLVLGRPLAIWTWALPPSWRPAVSKPLRWHAVRAVWRWSSAPLAATVLHAAALWVWHAPPLFAAAQESVGVHAVQHSAFLVTALLFWNAVLQPRDSAVGPSILWLFVTMLHTGALGVLLTFSARRWYPADVADIARWGLTPLEDQQLGGLIMWIPAGTVYMLAALALAARWLYSGAHYDRSVSSR